MLHLHSRKKVISLNFFALIFFVVFFSNATSAQLFRSNLGGIPISYGLTLGANNNRFSTNYHPKFLESDSIYVAEPKISSGFHLGLSATVTLSDHLQLRLNPTLMFFERPIYYKLNYQSYFTGDSAEIKKVESVIISVPFQVRLVSDRIGNFSFYSLAGLKLDIDAASNADSRKAEDLIKINSYDYGFELGVGCNFHFRFFTLSPEVKLSNGFTNLHSRDKNLIYSSVFDKIYSRMVVFSIHIGD